MQKSLRSLFSLSWQSLAYGVGFFGRQVIVLISLPIITNLVSQTDFGAISIITSFYLVINTLTNVGIPSATFRLYNDDVSQEEKQNILGTSQGIFFFLALVLAIPMIIFSGSVSSVLLGSTGFHLAITFVALLLVVETLNYYGSILLRLQIRPGALSVHTLVTVVSQMGLAIVFIKFLSWGVAGYWAGFLIGAFVGLLLMIWYNHKIIVFSFSSETARNLLKFGIPLIPTTLAISLLQLSDRYFLRRFLDLDVVAIYAVGYRAGSLVNLVLAPFQYAWPNFAFSIVQDAEAKQIYKHVTTFLLFGTGFFSLGTYLFRTELISLLSPENYQQAASLVAWISAAMILNGLYPIASLGPKIQKDTRPLAWIALAATIVNVILLVILIPAAGFRGAAAATFFSYLFLAAGSYLVGQRYYQYPLDWRRLGIIIISILGLAWAGNLLDGLQSGAGVYLLRIGLMACYPLILALLGIIPIKEVVLLAREYVQGLASRGQP